MDDKVRLKNLSPILRVKDLDASIKYFVEMLGFGLDWTDPGGVASVSRDDAGIFLCQGDQGNPGSWLWIGATDVEALAAEFRKSGAKIRHEPTNYHWAYEMQVEDLDGNVLRFGSSPKEDEPMGEWLDMDGRRWVKNETGPGWRELKSEGD